MVGEGFAREHTEAREWGSGGREEQQVVAVQLQVCVCTRMCARAGNNDNNNKEGFPAHVVICVVKWVFVCKLCRLVRVEELFSGV